MFLPSSSQTMKNKQEKESGTLKYKLSLSFKSAKFGSKTTNCTLAASGDRELEGHRIANISLSIH